MIGRTGLPSASFRVHAVGDLAPASALCARPTSGRAQRRPGRSRTLDVIAVEGIACTSPECPCLTFRNQSAALGLLKEPKGPDSIIFPLVAGTLAHCVIASARRNEATLTGLRLPGLAEHARIVLKLADAAAGGRSWERDRQALSTIVEFVMAGWDVFLEWVPDHYLPVIAAWTEPTAASLLDAARQWVERSKPRSLTELVLFSVDVANRLLAAEAELPILAKAMRPVRVEIAARLRAGGLTTWPRVLSASVRDWSPDTLASLLLDFASDAGGAFLAYDTTLEEERATWPRDRAPAADMVDVVQPEPASMRRERDDRFDGDAEVLLADAIAQIDRVEARTRAVEAKRLELADGYAGLQRKIEHLTNDLAVARQEVAGLRAELSAARRGQAPITAPALEDP
jgi:hypothetical protein